MKFKNSKTVYGTSILWGITGDIAEKAEKWRGVFKSAKYTLAGTMTMLSSWKLKEYQCNIEFKNSPSSLEDKVGEDEEEAEESKLVTAEDIHNELFEKHKSLKAPSYEKHAQSFSASLNNEELMGSLSSVNNTIVDDFKQTQNDSWSLHEDTNVAFFGIVTHECRNSSRFKEQFMPPARFNDGKMHIGTLQK